MSTVFLGQSLENENKLGKNNLIFDLNGLLLYKNSDG